MGCPALGLHMLFGDDGGIISIGITVHHKVPYLMLAVMTHTPLAEGLHPADPCQAKGSGDLHLRLSGLVMLHEDRVCWKCCSILMGSCALLNLSASVIRLYGCCACGGSRMVCSSQGNSI